MRIFCENEPSLGHLLKCYRLKITMDVWIEVMIVDQIGCLL